MNGGKWRYVLGGWRMRDIFYGCVGVGRGKLFLTFFIGLYGIGGGNSSYILEGWGCLDIFYGWVGLVGGIC